MGHTMSSNPTAASSANSNGIMRRFLSEAHAPALCKQALAGKTFKKLATQKLADPITVEDADTLDLPGPFSPTIARYAKLKLDPAAAPVTIGYFTYESSAGSGCHAAGVVLLHGQDIEKSPRNTALLGAEGDMTNCRGSDAFVIRAGGQRSHRNRRWSRRAADQAAADAAAAAQR